MNKKMMWVIGLAAFCILSFIYARGSTDIHISKMVIRDVPMWTAMLLYTGIGMTIGVLLK